MTRAETRALAAELGLPFMDDPDNESVELRRSRLRSQLIPQLEQQYNPQLRAVLVRTASVMAADDGALESLAAGISVAFDGETVAIATSALAVVPQAVAARVVRRALRELRGPHGGTHGEVNAVLDVAAGTRGAAELSGALRAEREGPMVVVSGPVPEPADPISVTAVGEVLFDRWRLRFTTSDVARAPRPLGARTLISDADLLWPGLTVRAATPADRIDIGIGTKTVADALGEAGVPRRLRARWPVLIAEGRVAMVPGVRCAAWARSSNRTSRYLEAQIDAAAERD